MKINVKTTMITGNPDDYEKETLCEIISEPAIVDDHVETVAVIVGDCTETKYRFLYCGIGPEEWDEKTDGQYPGLLATVDTTEQPDEVIKMEDNA